MFKEKVEYCKEKIKKGVDFVKDHKVEAGILGGLVAGLILPKVATRVLYTHTWDGLTETYCKIDDLIDDDPDYVLTRDTYHKYRLGHNKYHRIMHEAITTKGATHTMREYDRILKAKGIDWQKS